MQKQYYVYIATNRHNTTLYTGITNDLHRRMHEHREKLMKGFTMKYNIDKLVFFESFNSPEEVISAEKKIKGWTRKKKIELIERSNSRWTDLET